MSPSRLKPMLRTAIVLGVTAVCGCGGGGAPQLGGSSRAGTLARFNVDVKTGKVTVTPIDDPRNPSRAVFTGGAVAFATSDLYSEGGDSGQRLLRIDVSNGSGQVFNGPGKLVIGNILNNGAVDLAASTTVSTMAGSGASGSADGYGTAASFTGVTSVASANNNATAFYVSDQSNQTIRMLTADGTVTTLAGSVGTTGATDGVGSAARFYAPAQISADSAGNAFVADSFNNRIRRITPLGAVTTIGGTGAQGSTPGTGDSATFARPFGIAVTADGERIYVADFLTHMIRLMIHNGGPRDKATSYNVINLAGNSQGNSDGPGNNAQFNFPLQLALGPDYNGPLYVADSGNNTIRRIDNPFGGQAMVSTIAGDGTSGTQDGVGPTAKFNYPCSVAVVGASGANALIVSDRYTVRAITYQPGSEPSQAGNYLVRTVAGASTLGTADGSGTVARFNKPAGLCVIPTSGPAVTVLCADDQNNRVRKINITSPLHSGGPGSGVTEPVRLVNWDAEVPNQTAWYKLIGYIGQNGTSTTLQFYIPQGVSGFSFTAYLEGDTDVVNLPGVGVSYLTTVAGNGSPGTFNGPGKLAQFMAPYTTAPVAGNGPNWTFGQVRALIADADSQRVRYLTPDGQVKTLAGSGVYGFTDGPLTTAMFRRPRGVAIHPDGSVFVTDSENHAIRRIGPTGVVTTVAGSSANAGASDGPGNTATLTAPDGIVVDAGGMIYLTEGSIHLVRRLEYMGGDPAVASSYYLRTVAGQAGVSGSAEGTGNSARFKNPTGICCDTDGRVYVADALNHTVRVLIRSGNACSTTTLAGLAGSAGNTDGTGAAARFNIPTGVTVDTAHNVYVAEFAGSRIRRISPGGDTKTLMGSTGTGFTDGANGTMLNPWGISIEANGNLLIADYGNKSIRCLQRLMTNAHPPSNAP